jgi:2-polyprenyl-3-methyl-5-hydroxy-6-metoxy-1,4-benzoquinol methylase
MRLPASSLVLESRPPLAEPALESVERAIQPGWPRTLSCDRMAPARHPACPVCLSPDTRVLCTHSAQSATRHFEVGYGFSDRDGEVRRHLEALWEPDGAVEIRRCEACGFGFAWPHVAGGAEFYNLVTGGTPEYPQDRWEFARTIEALASADRERPMRLVEAGAGDGAFLRLLREQVGDVDALALEYDRGAAEELRGHGFEALEASLVDLAADERHRGAYDVVCLFQTLEHMDEPGEAARALSALLRAGGSAFVSVPNGDAIDAQEALTGFWDMPPNHVGRWTRRSFEKWVNDTGLMIAEDDLEPSSDAARASAYASAHMMADRYARWSWVSLAHRVRHPIAIDVLTRRRRQRYERVGLGLGDQLPAATYWIHIVRAS